jgi:hypothetical protein
MVVPKSRRDQDFAKRFEEECVRLRAPNRAGGHLRCCRLQSFGIIELAWACSSAGRAPALQAWNHIHQILPEPTQHLRGSKLRQKRAIAFSPCYSPSFCNLSRFAATCTTFSLRVRDSHLTSQHGLPFIASHPSCKINGKRPNAASGSAHLTPQIALTASPAKAIRAR